MGNNKSASPSIINSKIPEEEPKIQYKICIVGPKNSGKTSLFLRYCFNEDLFTSKRSYSYTKSISINNSDIKLDIIDTCKDDFINYTWIRGAHGIIMVFDILNKNILEDINNCLVESERYKTENLKIIIVGNKYDLEYDRIIPYEDINNFVKGKNLKYLEISTNDNINIDLLFNTLIHSILDLPLPNSTIKSARK